MLAEEVGKPLWNSLEVVKLVVQGATPVAVALLGVYLTRLAKRFEHLQWRNQRLIEKQIVIYDDLAPALNDVLCYFTFIGCWKELTPPEVIKLKRVIDKKIYLASPLFSDEFFGACINFMAKCYATYQGWGLDAKLKTTSTRRREAAGDAWKPSWNDCFSQEPSDPKEIREAYKRIMHVFSKDIGLSSAFIQQPVGRVPGNISSDRPTPASTGRSAAPSAR